MESEISFSKSKVEAVGCDQIHQKAPILEKDGVFEVNTPSKFIDGGKADSTSPDRETGESVVDIVSPLTCVSSSLPLGICTDSGAMCEVSDVDSSPQTPKEGVFDPFAPGSDDMLFAPQVKKHVKELKVRIARRLDFVVEDVKEMKKEEKGDLELEDSSSSLQEEVLLETMYESFLDAIVSKQTESVVAKDIEVCEEGLKTPTKFPLLTGIAETCPAAPMKPRPDSRKINMELCRKLEF